MKTKNSLAEKPESGMDLLIREHGTGAYLKSLIDKEFEALVEIAQKINSRVAGKALSVSD